MLHAENGSNTSRMVMTEAAIDGGLTAACCAPGELDNGAWADAPVPQTVCPLDMGGGSLMALGGRCVRRYFATAAVNHCRRPDERNVLLLRRLTFFC
ncbi:hypothetical protein OQK38_20115 [Salmonella enterica]|nr:hypothetical protein [Salmonella enterica]